MICAFGRFLLNIPIPIPIHITFFFLFGYRFPAVFFVLLPFLPLALATAIPRDFAANTTLRGKLVAPFSIAQDFEILARNILDGFVIKHYRIQSSARNIPETGTNVPACFSVSNHPYALSIDIVFLSLPGTFFAHPCPLIRGSWQQFLRRTGTIVLGSQQLRIRHISLSFPANA